MVFSFIRQNKIGIYIEGPGFWASWVKALVAHTQWKTTLTASTKVEFLDIGAIDHGFDWWVSKYCRLGSAGLCVWVNIPVPGQAAELGGDEEGAQSLCWSPTAPRDKTGIWSRPLMPLKSAILTCPLCILCVFFSQKIKSMAGQDSLWSRKGFFSQLCRQGLMLFFWHEERFRNMKFDTVVLRK